jgi:hypothetical protein
VPLTKAGRRPISAAQPKRWRAWRKAGPRSTGKRSRRVARDPAHDRAQNLESLEMASLLGLASRDGRNSRTGLRTLERVIYIRQTIRLVNLSLRPPDRFLMGG